MIWPVGTMVVAREPVEPGDGGRARPRGACGVVVKAPDQKGGDYRVRFPDGGEFWVAEASLAVLKEYQRGQIGDSDEVLEQHDLYEHVHYRCVVGSKAYGLDHADSDTDLRGFYLPPADLHWSLYGVPEQLERPGADVCYWEIEKFLKLALKANPNILECLYTPLVREATPLAEALLARREMFLSQLIYQTYSRYVMSQFKKMTRLRERGEQPNPKHMMHLIRLMLSGLMILRHGLVPLKVTAHRERLLAIKAGEVPWEEVDRWRLALHDEFDEALQTTDLPERPDYAGVNAFLVRARRWAAGFEVDWGR